MPSHYIVEATFFAEVQKLLRIIPNLDCVVHPYSDLQIELMAKHQLTRYKECVRLAALLFLIANEK